MLIFGLQSVEITRVHCLRSRWSSSRICHHTPNLCKGLDKRALSPWRSCPKEGV